MGLLYRGLEELLRGVDEMSPKLVEMPAIADMTTTMIYLGPLTDLAGVEIKKDKNTKGWLYNTNSIVFFRHEDVMYEVFISTLRELAEEKFVAKKLIKPEDPISAGVMVRYPDARIVGFIHTQDLLAISNQMQDGRNTE